MSGCLTAEGYAYYWAGLFSVGLLIGCVVASRLIGGISIELRRIHIELGGIRERLAMRNLAVSSAELSKALRKAKR